VNRAHDARIHHVERGGEEDGREEKEDGLEYEGAEAGSGEMGEYAAEEADDFDYNGQSDCAALYGTDLVGSGSRRDWS
jgi:hypothetical protein